MASIEHELADPVVGEITIRAEYNRVASAHCLVVIVHGIIGNADSGHCCAAAKAATRTIPIVFTLVADPIASGLVASLARPSGNITGLPSIASEIIGKQLELLKETVARVSRVAVLQNPDASSHQFMVREAAGAARALGVQLRVLEARSPNDLDAAFTVITGEQMDALLVLADPFFRTHKARIADFAAKSRLPSVSGEREQTEVGGLMSYGPSRLDMFRRAAYFVDKIL